MADSQETRMNANPKKPVKQKKLYIGAIAKKYICCLKVELGFLLVLVAFVWILLSIPFVIFYLQKEDNEIAKNISVELKILQGDIRDPGLFNTTNCSLNCTEDFYCKNGPRGEICSPTCNWNPIVPDFSSPATDILVSILVASGLLVGSLVLIIACIRRKKMLTFPFVLIIYQNAAWMLGAVIEVISLSAREPLYCVNNDFLQTVLYSTPFCVFTGVMFYYGLLHLISWWLCYLVILFSKIVFPLKSRFIDYSSRAKYIHAVCIIVSVTIPLLPVVVTLLRGIHTDGATTVGFITAFPPLLCFSTDPEANFYSLVIPLILASGISITLLILLLWFVHKTHVRSKIRQSSSVNLRSKKDTNPFKIGTAEKKLLVIIIYYVIIAVLSMITYTVYSGTLPLFVKTMLEYFVCEANGPNDCDRTAVENLTYPIPVNIAYVLFGINPWLNLVFVINFDQARAYFSRRRLLTLKQNSDSSRT